MPDHDASAWGSFADEVNETGWSRLHILTNSSRSDEEQTFAAGYLEGLLTQPQIYHSFLNNFGPDVPRVPEHSVRFVEVNRKRVGSNPTYT